MTQTLPSLALRAGWKQFFAVALMVTRCRKLACDIVARPMHKAVYKVDI